MVFGTRVLRVINIGYSNPMGFGLQLDPVSTQKEETGVGQSPLLTEVLSRHRITPCSVEGIQVSVQGGLQVILGPEQG